MNRGILPLLAAMAVLIFAASTAVTDPYELQSMRLTANVPVKITISDGPPIQQPVYRTAAGEWKQLPFEQEANRISFSPPEDALPSTVIVMDKPEWLQLSDDDAPAITAVGVDGASVPVSELIRLGHLSTAPKTIIITATDAANPIAASRISAHVNGREPGDLGGEVSVDPSGDGKRLDIAINPGDLDQAPHSIIVSVSDASPQHNTTMLEITFTTAPLLTNGDFEMADDQGRPKHWSTSTWSSDAETKAEFQIVEGGHTGKALKIEGIAGSLNMVCAQSVDLIPGEMYVLSGYYKNDRNIGSASIIAKKDGKQDQYSNMPSLKHAQDWTEFSWEFTAKEDNSEFMLYLRASGVGTVWFDDVTLTRKQ